MRYSLWGKLKVYQFSKSSLQHCMRCKIVVGGLVFLANMLSCYLLHSNLELAFEYMLLDKSAFKMKVGYISDVKYAFLLLSKQIMLCTLLLTSLFKF